MTLTPPAEAALLGRARAVMEGAYAPYSGLRVGAAVLDENGSFHVGCNVENGSYGLTLCAERAAIAAMVSHGGHRLMAAAVVCDAPILPWPCGACRQVMGEFAEDAPVVVESVTGERGRATLAQLAPDAFRFRLPGQGG